MKISYLLCALLIFPLAACNGGQATVPGEDAASTEAPAATVIPSLTPGPAPTADGRKAGEAGMRVRDGAVMVYAPAGEFVMGSSSEAVAAARTLCHTYSGKDAIGICTHAAFENEYPAHKVALSGFWLDRLEVTNGQYQRCVEAGACTPPTQAGSFYRPSYYGDPAFSNYPVIWVRYQQAADYCAWAGGRLPSEAEWEYAARSPESLVFPWGNVFDGTRLNYCDKNCDGGPNDPGVDDGYADTAPVGSYPAGASWVGALDLAGNVREWTADWYGPYPAEGQVNPQGPGSGAGHSPRGGAWLDKPDDARSANRGENSPDYSEHKVGFRCALDGTSTSLLPVTVVSAFPAGTAEASAPPSTAMRNTYTIGLGPQMGAPCPLLYYDGTLKLKPDCSLRLRLTDRVGVTRYFGVTGTPGGFTVRPDLAAYRKAGFSLLACEVEQVDDNVCVYTLEDDSGSYRLEVRLTGVE